MSDKQNLETVYWNLRAVLEVAQDTLQSPHELWGYLNECFEDIDRIEQSLGIANKMKSGCK
jgi:hypothetical protein